MVFAIGYLCPGSESEHIQPGSRLELPLWMACSLCSRRRHIATVEVPRPYRSGHRKILDADAAVVDLHKFCPYYYSVGTRLLAFELAESTDIARLLLLVLLLLLFFCLVYLSFLVFTALHAMQTRSSDENSVRLSVCPSVCLSVRLSHA